MSYIGVLILIVLCLLCILGAYLNLKDLKKLSDQEIRGQKIFSSLGLFFFGGIGVIILLILIIL